MRSDVHKIALRVIRTLLDGARSFELDVGATRVTCAVTRGSSKPWPANTSGIAEEEDGPWPSRVSVECSWSEGRGKCRLFVDPYRYTSKLYRDDLAINVYTGESGSTVAFINVSTEIDGTSDGGTVDLGVRGYLSKRKSPVMEVVEKKIKGGLLEVLQESKLPMSKGKKVALCRVVIPSGEMTPSAEDAFQQLVRVALLKLDFLDRGGTAGRGSPLFNLGRWLTPAEVQTAQLDAAAERALAPGVSGTRILEEEEEMFEEPLNLILHGPPGTGKTHELTTHWFEKFRWGLPEVPDDTSFVEALTWVELIALGLHGLGGSATVAALEQHPLVKAKCSIAPIQSVRERLWATLQRHTVETSTTVHYSKRAAVQWFDKKDDSTWFLATALPEELLSRRASSAALKRADNFVLVTFHQAYGYEDFIEGIRPRLDSDDEESGDLSYSLEDGAFLKAARAALRLSGYGGTLHDLCLTSKEERERQFAGAPHYAVFIDEINRGNVARIFGELITLLEDDKRLGAANEVIVQLPHSKKLFGVPPNLHVIGTMNTADRSIEALDTALRRRFEFQEMPPNLDVVKFEVEGIRIDEMLRVINRRLEQLYDRDHRLGHAYFCPLQYNPTLDELKRIFRNKVLPLLQEYFHSDWGKIGLVLGKPFVGRRAQSPKLFAKFDHEELELLAEKAIWELKDISELGADAFRQIYEDVANA
jgi:AAA domain (dynein-related subfamily)